ncbi:MAG TPA: cytidylate kinase-like family protein [Acidimicrobiales bacterium]|nr:cytidylate kinase-like family protein [Acidimicrobiales bacterium]
MRRVVTISGSYGAGGSVVGPAVAQLLDLAFLDRAVVGTDVEAAARPRGEAAVEEERTSGFFGRLAASFATMPDAYGPGAPPGAVAPSDEALRIEAESRVREFVAANDGGVVLGWGASVFLAEAFHVRLDGPLEARLAQAAAIEGIDLASARRRGEETDRIRSLYVRRLYGRDWRDWRLYHLVVDSCSLPLGEVASLLASAAQAYFRARQRGSGPGASTAQPGTGR